MPQDPILKSNNAIWVKIKRQRVEAVRMNGRFHRPNSLLQKEIFIACSTAKGLHLEDSIESRLWLGSWGSAQDKALGRFCHSMAGSLLSKQQLQKGRVCSKLIFISHCSPQHSPRHTAVFVIWGWTQRREKGEGKEERKRGEGDRERGEGGDGKKSQRGANERNLHQEESSAGQSEAGLRQSDPSQQGDWRHFCIPVSSLHLFMKYYQYFVSNINVIIIITVITGIITVSLFP